MLTAQRFYAELRYLIDLLRAQLSFFIASVFGPFNVQTSWYIDAVNGSDSNSGSSPTAAIKTFTRLLQLVAPFGLWTVRATTTVHLLSDLLPTDRTPLRVTCLSGDLLIVAAANANADPGGSGLILVAKQSTLTASTPIDRATVGAGMPETGTDATANWTAATDFLFNDLSDAPNTFSWVNRDAGGGVAWFTKLMTMPGVGLPLYPFPFVNLPALAPIGNDRYTILRGVKTYFTSITVEHQSGPASVGSGGNVYLNGLWNEAVLPFEFPTIDGGEGGYFGLYATLCRFDGSPVLYGNPCFENCLFKDGVESGPDSQPLVIGGGVKRFFANTLSAGTFDGDLLITNCFPFFGNSDNLIGQIGVIGNSVHVGRTDGIGTTHIEAQLYAQGVIWGSSPIFVHSGSTLLYATTAVACYTANAGFTLGAATQGSPQALDGSYRTTTTYTWAHVDAPVGNGTGFGGFVSDIASGASVRFAA